MANPEWGIKRICPSCGTRYYDFAKDPPVCPACNTVFDPEALLRSRRARSTASEDVKKPAPGTADLEAEEDNKSDDVDIDLEDDESGADLIEDASELDDSDDDLDGVVDTGDDSNNEDQ